MRVTFLLTGVVLTWLGSENAGAIRTPRDTALAGSSPRVVPAVIGRPVSIDLRRFFNSSANLVNARFIGDDHGLTLERGVLRGTPRRIGVLPIEVATTVSHASTIDTVRLVVFTENLPEPVPSRDLHPYRDLKQLPGRLREFLGLQSEAERIATSANAFSDARVRLGRVLFYDTRLSVNDSISCSSCHRQEFGFGDTARVSKGVGSKPSSRRSIALVNARFGGAGFSWDGSAPTVEQQILRALQNPAEHGMQLADVVAKLSATNYYRGLFGAAYGSTDVTTERVSQALAQFVRALVSDSAPFDRATDNGSPTTAARRMTPAVFRGWQRFNAVGCASCHYGPAMVALRLSSNGLPAGDDSVNALRGHTRAPSLRNVAVRGRYMHDGRFASLDEVLAFYETARPAIRKPSMVMAFEAVPMTMSGTDRSDIVAFLHSLTDSAFLTDERYSDPFRIKSARAHAVARHAPATARLRDVRQRDSARIVGDRLLVEPLGVSLAIPPLWFDKSIDRGGGSACDPTSPSARRLITKPAELRTMTGTTDYFGDWQSSVVSDSLFPPGELVAHLGENGWRECDSSVGDLHVRVYVSDRSPASIISRTRGIVVDSFPGYSAIKSRQLGDSAGWSRARLEWIFDCGDCTSMTLYEVMSRRVGTRTLSLVFLHAPYAQVSGNAVRGILRSLLFRTTALPATPPPDSLVYLNALCIYGRCDTWRATIASGGFIRFARGGGRELPPAEVDSLTAPTGTFAALLRIIDASRLREAPVVMERETGRACPSYVAYSQTPTLLLYGATGIEKRWTQSVKCGSGASEASGPAWSRSLGAIESIVRDSLGFAAWLARGQQGR